MRRKVMSWREHQPPREWIPTLLECGHTVTLHAGDEIGDVAKTRIDADGYHCDTCAFLQDQIDRYQGLADKARAELADSLARASATFAKSAP